MDWNAILAFARGPLFNAALLIFIGGMLFRLFRVVMLGWGKDYSTSRGSKATGVVQSYLKGLFVLPFWPWVKGTFQRNPIPYIAGGLFHLGLFVVIFLGTAHMLVWKDLLGFGWPTLPMPIVDWLAVAAIAGMLALLVNRLVHPVMKMLSGPSTYINWMLVFLPMITGYIMTHHLFFRYEVAYSLHMLSVDAMLIWIPFSRISHFMFYFFSRTMHGAELGKQALTP
ncbi:MAG: hypothetical protein R3C44_21695 [Chloroflexota bacterium]